MKTNKTISIDTDVVASKEFREIVNQNKLSSLINQFLRTSLNVKEIEKNKDKEELERTIEELQAKTSTFQEQLQQIKDKEQKQKDEHPLNEGWKQLQDGTWYKEYE